MLTKKKTEIKKREEERENYIFSSVSIIVEILILFSTFILLFLWIFEDFDKSTLYKNWAATLYTVNEVFHLEVSKRGSFDDTVD